jgi:capsular exopolysaccharide synthesis family protein
LVTSPAEQEGKTFVSVNLAASYAQANKKTIIIDCDLRRPRIQSIMKVDKKPGLTDYLSGKVKLDEVIRITKVPNLAYITSGIIPPNAAEVLESKEMTSFLLEIRTLFEVVILDSPPIIAVIDAEILAKMADGTILVVCAEKTISRLLRDAMELIRKDKALFLGTVLNNFKYRSGYGYYYKYYYNYSKNSNKRGLFKSTVKL